MARIGLVAGYGDLPVIFALHGIFFNDILDRLYVVFSVDPERLPGDDHAPDGAAVFKDP